MTLRFIKYPVPKFLVFILTCAICAANTLSAETKRIQGGITGIRDSGLVSVEHYSTGFGVDLNLAQSTSLRIVREVDLDEYTSGKPIQFWIGEHKMKKSSINLNGELLRPVGEKNFKDSINFPAVSGRFIKRKRQSSDPTHAILSRDGTQVMGVKIKENEYIFTHHSKAYTKRPRIEITERAHPEDARVGQEIEFSYEAGKGEEAIGKLLSVTLYDRLPGGFPYYMNNPAGPSGVSKEEIEDNLRATLKQHQNIKGELERLMPVKMLVSPGLVSVGERCVLRMEVLASHEPNQVVTVQQNHILEQPDVPQKRAISWKKTGTSQVSALNIYQGELVLPTDKPGQHLVSWKSDIGGDIEVFYRNYAVVTSDTTICTIQINNFPPDLRAVFDELKIPFHMWEPGTSEVKKWRHASASQWAAKSRYVRQMGGSAEHGLMYMQWGEGQIREDPPEVQQAGLNLIKTMSPLLGYPYAGNSFWHYTFGTETVNIARDLGFNSVSALCTELHVDGSMGINHFGRPERPYFISKEDFRKPSRYKENNMIGLSQVQRHTLLAREYRCGYNFEPGNGGLIMGAGGRSVWDDIALSRIFDAYDAFFQLQESQNIPFVIQTCLEFSGSRMGAAEGNRMVPRYAVQKAREGQKVVFANSRDITDYYLRNYDRTPETVSYQQDYWAGFTGKPRKFGVKPLVYPDYMQMENHEFCVYARHGDILPYLHYDYMKTWDYPDFGNEDIKRKRDGFGYPADDHDKYAVTPSITDTRSMRATRENRERPDGALEIRLRVTSDQARNSFPLALFDIPRSFEKGTKWFSLSQGRFVPVKAPYSHNLNGFVVVDLKKGDNEIVLVLSSNKRPVRSLDIDWDAKLGGKVFYRQGRHIAYVGLNRPWDTRVNLTIPEGKEAIVAVAPKGELQTFKAGTHSFTIPKEQWARIIGLSRDDLQGNLKAE